MTNACILLEFFKPMIMGGGEVDAENYVNDLVKQGIEVYVLTPNYSAYKTEIEKKDKLTGVVVINWKKL